MVGQVTWALAGVLVCLVADTVTHPVSVRSLHMQSHIKYRFATTLVTSSMFNDDSRSHEAMFEVNLPEEAFISNFSMTVDGEVYPGRVEEKEKASKAYHEAKRKGQSAGYIKTTARHSNKFDVAVNLKPGSGVTFNLTYQQVLVRCHGMYEHKMHVDPGRGVRDMKIEVFIEETRNITELDASLKKELNDIPLDETDITVETPSERIRYIMFTPSAKQQEKEGDKFTSGEFLVKYDVERTSPAGEVLVVDGYFLHFFAPENSGDAPPIPKDIVFVLDVSGSMSGMKIYQLKDAMRTILSELSRKDTFNIVTFNDRLRWWKDRLVPVNKDTIKQSLQYVQGLHADDGTDINLAMTSGVQFLLNNRDRTHTSIVFFLTDGEPTVGVRHPSTIANNVDRNNEHTASVFGLAFGEGADYNLVKIIAVQNDGFARRIYAASDASKQVEGFYEEISSTMMLNLSINYMNSSVQLDTLTPTFFKNIFEGNDVVIAGKVDPGILVTNVITGMITAEKTDGPMICSIEENETTFLGPADPLTNPYFEIPMDFSAVTEKSWAYLTIKQLLKQKKKETYKKVNGSDVDKKILELSLRYNFVTPLTSLVATKPEAEVSKASVRGDEYVPVASMSTGRKNYHHRKPYSSNTYNYQPQPMVPMSYKPPQRPTLKIPRRRKGYIARGGSFRDRMAVVDPQFLDDIMSTLPVPTMVPPRPARTNDPIVIDPTTTTGPLPVYTRRAPRLENDRRPSIGTKKERAKKRKEKLKKPKHTNRKGTIGDQCNQGYFRCKGGLCIAEDLRCNIRFDCPDGSDEENCMVDPQFQDDLMSTLPVPTMVPPRPARTNDPIVIDPLPVYTRRAPQVGNYPSPSILRKKGTVAKGKLGRPKKRRRKPKRTNRKCTIVRSMLEGFETEIDSKTSCVKVKKALPGVYQLIAEQDSLTNSGLFVNVTILGSIKRPFLDSISAEVFGKAYLFKIDRNIITSGNHTEAGPALTILKQVTCNGRRGKAKLFLVFKPQAPNEGRKRRDLIRRSRIRKMSLRGHRKHALYRKCNGRPQKETLSKRSPRSCRGFNISYDSVIQI